MVQKHRWPAQRAQEARDGLDGSECDLAVKRRCIAQSFDLESAVENHFTAKTPRAQRTYSKDKIHPIGEGQERTHFHSNPCFSLASSRLCGESFIPTAFFRIRHSPIYRELPAQRLGLGFHFGDDGRVAFGFQRAINQTRHFNGLDGAEAA